MGMTFEHPGSRIVAGIEWFWIPRRGIWVDQQMVAEIVTWVHAGWSVDAAIRELGARRGFTTSSL
jgi:hypothetical protein